jgi:hypothetical protein
MSGFFSLRDDNSIAIRDKPSRIGTIKQIMETEITEEHAYCCHD